jgi:hypothetical protein
MLLERIGSHMINIQLMIQKELKKLAIKEIRRILRVICWYRIIISLIYIVLIRIDNNNNNKIVKYNLLLII